jgi:hypothetical protein
LLASLNGAAVALVERPAPEYFSGMRYSKLAAAGCLLLAGCDSEEPPPTQLGQFGVVEFAYECSGPGDAACDTACDDTANATLCEGRTVDRTILPTLALGSRFRLTPDAPVTLAPASESRLVKEGDDFVAAFEGITAVLALKSNGDVQDLVHVAVVGVETVNIDFRADFVATTGNFEGAARIVMLGPGDMPLAGTFPCTWTTSDPAIVTLTSDPTDNTVEFETGAVGTATLRAELGDYSGELEIEVSP